MFSEACEKRIELQYKKRVFIYPLIHSEIEEAAKKCTEEEMLFLKYLYTTMPLSDMANYRTEVFIDYAKHGVFLWKESPYSKDIPEDMFLNYVVGYRINEEDISPCRSFFYEHIKDRIAGKSMEEAVICVNYWCAEEATYRSTDERTVSPMTVYRSAYGRCGEESTFTVSALRSVGIPARQVYAPRWSHCDDNHAWTEVYCNGRWYFLGACEPEEILNKGWFTNASSRAMLIHSRWFDTEESEEEVIKKSGIVTELNQLSRYAETVVLKVLVVDKENNPVKDAKVDFEVLNYSEFFPVASVQSDKNGEAKIRTGLGSCHIYVWKDGIYGEAVVDTKKESSSCVILGEHIQGEFEMLAPTDAPININMPDTEQKKAGEIKFAEAAAKRKIKETSFYKEETANRIQKKYGYSLDILDILKESRGNFEEIIQFLDNSENTLAREELLKMLTIKDYRDCKRDILEEHLQYAYALPYSVPKHIFNSYILSPRVYFEPLSFYRKGIEDYFTKEEKEVFRKNPELIWDKINTMIAEKPEEEYSALITLPLGCLNFGIGSELSKKIVFVSICRTLGIPARLNKTDLSMEYYRKDKFLPVISSAKKSSILKLTSGECKKWVYFQDWSMAVYKNGKYESLHLENLIWEKEQEIKLESGVYRLLTSNRLPNGSIFCKSYCFNMEEKETKELEISLKKAKLSDMLENIPISDFALKTKDNMDISALEITKERKNLILWLEESKEPTEHILNELYEKKNEFNELDIQIIFVIKGEKALQDPTIRRTLGVLQKVHIYYDTFTVNVNTLGRRMYVDPDKLPLIIVTNTGLNGVYASSGYNVGTADLLLRILNEDNKS